MPNIPLISRYCIKAHAKDHEPPLLAASQAQAAVPKKGPRRPVRPENKERILQKSNEDPASAVKLTPTCKKSGASPVILSFLLHEMKLLLVQKDAVPTEFFGVGDFGLMLIWFHDLVSHWPNSRCQRKDLGVSVHETILD